MGNPLGTGGTQNGDTQMIEIALSRTVTYQLTYPVLADSRLDAIFKAGKLLRTNVRVVELVECEQGTPGWYDVVLLVEETL